MQIQHCPKHPVVFKFWWHAHDTCKELVCGESFFQQCSNFPHYMENTQSFKAKVRFHSAPKQRPMQHLKKVLLWLDRSTEFIKEADSDYLHRRW
ncbi:hypothetical protein AAC387_Pa03g4524 [Persea americana]